MLKVVVGTRQIRHGVAVKQSRTVTAGDLAKVLDGIAQTARLLAVTGHGTDHAIETALNRGRVLVIRIVQDVRGLMDPLVNPFDVRPQRGGLLQAMFDQSLQRCKLRQDPPFCGSLATLSVTAFSRALSFSPEAASGGWPSSVMALRTAPQ